MRHHPDIWITRPSEQKLALGSFLLHSHRTGYSSP